LVDGALYVGQNSIKRFVPYWDKSDRYFSIHRISI